MSLDRSLELNVGPAPSRFRQAPIQNFPWWVVRKIGVPVIHEADFQAAIGFKWGTFVDGLGTVTPDANHYWGGTRSVKMTTAAVTNNSAELKINHPYLLGAGIYSFEHKWGWGDPAAAFAGSSVHLGIEPRENKSNGFWQGRVRARFEDDEYKYENGIDTYVPFDPPAKFHKSTLDTAVAQGGDQWSWSRIVIDTKKKEYVMFEFSGLGEIKTYDMRGISLVNRGSATAYNLLIFALVTTAGAGAENARTTDWCIAKLD